jgi:hypothetical protein
MLLVGCTPGIVGLMGLQRTGDGYRVVVATCPGYTLQTAGLADRSRVNDKQEFLTIQKWELSTADDGLASADIADVSEFENLIARGEFMLGGTIPGFIPAVVAGPDFTAEDLARLQVDEVLTVVPRSFENVVQRSADDMVASLDQADYC